MPCEKRGILAVVFLANLCVLLYNHFMDLKMLKSGTDIRGVALPISGAVVTLSNDAVKRLAAGFAEFVGDKYGNAEYKGKIKIAVGHDSRLSAGSLSDAAIEGLTACAGEVLFCGLASTPAMFMMTVLEGCDGAIMLTASHHPSDRNGMKFFTKQGGVSGTELDEIIKRAEKIDFDAHKTQSVFRQEDFLESYCKHMRTVICSELGTDKPLKGFKIAVDAGSGSAGFYADRILAPLGADVSSGQYLKPDGNFPFHAPNPEDKAAMKSISLRVIKTQSDLGVIFDTDGDRSAVVLSDGKEINRNRLIALSAAIVLRDCRTAAGNESGLNNNPIIVTDSTTSEGLKEFIAKLGGQHIRYKRGYQNVIGYAKQLCAEGKFAPLAIETSGHAALKENYFLDDGAYLAAKIIIEAVRLKREGKDLYSLIADLREAKEEASFRIGLKGLDWKKAGQEVLDTLTQLGKKYKIADDSFEGIRIYLEGGWFMARLSVHDPVVAVNIESDIDGGARSIVALLLEVLGSIKNVDISQFKDFLKC